MHKIRYSLFCYLAVATIVATAASQVRAADEQDAAQSQETPLIAVLQSDAPAAEKAITCKKLAVYGTQNAVPALAPLLENAELASWARIALEAISDSSADAALLAALDKVEGRLLIGVINSIGARRDTAAVAGLAEKLQAADADVASAAAAALGNIGDAEATKTLEQSLASAPAEIRSSVAEGCVLCAEKLLASGNAAAAARLYDQVREAEVPSQRILEATRGAILARGSDGVPLLTEQLVSADKAMYYMALTTARELVGPDVAESLVASLKNLPADRQGLLILALADRGDAAVLPTMLEAAQGGPKQVRVAAINALKRLGDASCVSALLSAATQDDEEIAQAAKTALETLAGDNVNEELAARLSQAAGKNRQVLIELVGARRIPAIDLLVEAASDPDRHTRSAALMALGSTVQLENLPVLIQRVVAPANDEDTEVAALALRAASVRMPDGEACAEKLAAAMSQAPVAAKATVLEILKEMGGAKALQTVAAAAQERNPELQDAASRLLGEWMTVDAAPVLLDLAKSNVEEKYKVRALRGCIRILRQFDVPDQQRTEMCRAVMQAAQRDAEKKLVLEVCARYPSVDMLKMAVEVSKDPSLKNEAMAASLAIAQSIGGSEDVQKVLAQVGHEPVKVEIIKAEYGAGSTFKDVTDVVRKHVGNYPLIVLRSSSYNSSFGGDPVPSVVKQLKIQYKIDGKVGEASFPENATILLPMPE